MPEVFLFNQPRPNNDGSVPIEPFGVVDVNELEGLPGIEAARPLQELMEVAKQVGETTMEGVLSASGTVEDKEKVGVHGKEEVEAAFISAGLCDEDYLRRYNAA